MTSTSRTLKYPAKKYGGKLSIKEVRKIIMEYLSGESSRKVGLKYGVNKGTVLRWLKANGVSRRTAGSEKGKRANFYGKHQSKKARRKIREAQMGSGNSRYGTHWSIEERKRRSEMEKGEKGNNWKGGISSENNRIRGSIETRLWREAVFARDNWTCQKCRARSGSKTVYLHSHHIKNFVEYPDLRFAIDNGIAFCKDCHWKFHNIYGRKNNNEAQIKKFLRIR